MEDQQRILLPLTPEYIGYGDIGLGQELFYSRRPNIEIRGEYEFKYHVDFDHLDIRRRTPVQSASLGQPTQRVTLSRTKKSWGFARSQPNKTSP